MKKILMSLLIIIFVFTIIPVVNAEEIPREGVTYFLQYPDGSEDVTENYDEAIASTKEEKLIFEGNTDSNGQVVLEGLGKTGEIRVVQTVPDGYNTREEEITVNLSQKRDVQMTNTSKLLSIATNPKTGMSFIFFAFVIGLTIYTIKTKKNKKILTVIPVIIAVALISNVKAETDDFTVTVKDSLGNGLANVPVKVYAKPVIDAKPAMKFSANGGSYFDGKTVMYYRLPSSSCSWDNFYESLDDNTKDYISDNHYGVYREGYFPERPDLPVMLTNGTTIAMNWVQNENVILVTIHLNGETYDFYGTTIDEFKTYDGPPYLISKIFNDMRYNKDKYFIGTDFDSSCKMENTREIVGERSIQDTPTDVYLCWKDRVNGGDGVYVDNYLMPGSIDDCFDESYYEFHRYGYLNLDYGDKDFYLDVYSDNPYTFVYNRNAYIDNYPRYFDVTLIDCKACTPQCPCLLSTDQNQASADGYLDVGLSKSEKFENKSIQGVLASDNEMHTIEVVYHGETIVKLDSNDLSWNDNDEKYYITNSTKVNKLKEYFDNFWNNSSCWSSRGNVE